MKLWLDDVYGPPGEDWTWVRTVRDAQEALLSGNVEYASLDHDLMDQPADQQGIALCEWMAERDIWPLEELAVHSRNQREALKMTEIIDRHGPYPRQTAWDAIAALKTGRVVELSLDYDLGGDDEHGKGIHVVDFIREQALVFDKNIWPRDGIKLHSANSYGVNEMTLSLETLARRTGLEVKRVTEAGHRRFLPRPDQDSNLGPTP